MIHDLDHDYDHFFDHALNGQWLKRLKMEDIS